MTQPQYCPYCGASWLEDAAFCMQCGRTLPLTIPPIQAEREQKPHKPKKRPGPNGRPAKRQKRNRSFRILDMMVTMKMFQYPTAAPTAINWIVIWSNA